MADIKLRRLNMIVHLWGKQGCAKCKALHNRLEKIKQTRDFTLVYHDIKTIEGLVAFCKHGSINGNTIPAVTIEGNLEPLSRENWNFPGSLPLYGEMGICTDYDNGGVVRPEAIEYLLTKAEETL
jgi:hypothetical protein